MDDAYSQYLQYLIQTISNQHGSTKRHVDETRAYFSNNRNVAGYSQTLKELIFTQKIQSAEGAHISDIDGNALLDITMGFGVHLFGHKVDFIDQALTQQIASGYALGPLYPNTAKVAALIRDMTGMPRSAFYNSGTEAVMVAMRIARAARAKNRIAIFKGAYHGSHDAVLTIRRDRKSYVAQTIFPGVPQSYLDHTVLLDFGQASSLQYIAEHADDLAAVLVEPVQSRHPERQSRAFLQDLRAVTQQHDVALIFDEVITGFRTANGGAAEHFNIKPDIALYGKVLGGGLPIGVVAGQDEYLDFIDGGQWSFGDESAPQSSTTFVAGTFCHHPLTMAAAFATLSHLKSQEGRVQQQLNARTQAFCDDMNGWFESQHLSLRISHFGSLFRFLLKGKAQHLYFALLKEGIYVWEGRNCFLSAAHSETDIKRLQNAIKRSCHELIAAGILNTEIPRPAISDNTIWLHTAIRMSAATLDLSALNLAFRTVTSQALGYPVDMQSAAWDGHDMEGLPDHLSACEDQAAAISLRHISLPDGGSILHIRALRELFDGWSLTLIGRELECYYRAYTEHTPVTSKGLMDSTGFHNWLGQHTPASPTGDVLQTQCIHAQLTASLPRLPELLQGFAQDLAKALPECESLTIGVPAAGQLQARQLRATGNCSTQLPITWTQDTTATELANQLHAQQNRFAEHYANSEPPPRYVFNVDKLDGLPFSRLGAQWQPVNESRSKHAVMCNLAQQGERVVITIKYAPHLLSSSTAQSLLNDIQARLKD